MQLQTFSLIQSGKNGNSKEIELAKKIGSHVKACRINFLNKIFDEVLIKNDLQNLKTFIPENALLIPIPKSAPLVTGAQWPSLEISKFLLNRKLGKEIIPYLQRIKAVPKAAFQSNSDERPSVKNHLETIEFSSEFSIKDDIHEIVLVDDFITQGRVGYACYQKIVSNYPNKTIKLFGLIRTITFSEINQCILPKFGTLKFNSQTGKTLHGDFK